MHVSTSTEKPLEVCGTLHAAKLLGLSVGTVQALVERGELKAWKTKGGHRRIYMDSVKDFQLANGLKVAHSPSSSPLRLLVVDDDPVFLTLVKRASATWSVSTDCITMNSAIEALMSISVLAPKLLLTDLEMPKVDGFEFTKQVRANTQFAHMHIIAVTAMKPTQVGQQGGLPQGVLLVEKPIDMRWLGGYLAALSGVAIG